MYATNKWLSANQLYIDYTGLPEMCYSMAVLEIEDIMQLIISRK